MSTRPGELRDRERIRDIVVSTGHFTGEEVDTAIELVDAWLACGESSGYLIHVVDDGADERRVWGYVCYGPTPLTDGTYDLYWIAVDPTAQRRGYGRQLVKWAERDVTARGGRLLLIETSSQPLYSPTVRFYERAGFALEARIRDFYKPGDDKLVFAKRFHTGG